ncbi:MFS transporter [Actinospica robiniae]|uniref:MFS transporter n=1 Tax=Actinospica robiniae TaxID=304901 RepID=UPI00068726B1|nr:MFS transporter [Actinospica robiniae]
MDMHAHDQPLPTVPETDSATDPIAAVPPGAERAHPVLPHTPMRAWIMWLGAVAVYLVAVFNRSSLGVAGLDAEHRFGISASALSTFSMLQLLVYAGMQIPVGLLIDRLGPRRMLISGLSVMCAAQACFAAVPSFGLALAARGLLGCGDAMVFISVLRIVAAWFPTRRVALLTQLTSLTGAAGGIASTWPLAWALRTFGWSGTFLGIAGAGLCVLVLPTLVVRDTPETAAPRVPRPRPDAPRVRVRTQMREAWARPHTRLGLWVHFTTGFPGAVFSLLWGYPFLVQGEGVDAGTASGLLTLLICAGMGISFGFGVLLTHRPQQRIPYALAVIGVTAGALAAVLLWPGRAPGWLLVVLICAYATNGGGSMIAFDIARSANPPESLGTASGMVNVGAFIASAITLQATGFLLDRTGAGHALTAAAALDGYKTAFCFPFVLLALGTVQILRLSRAAGEFTAAPRPRALRRSPSAAPTS